MNIFVTTTLLAATSCCLLAQTPLAIEPPETAPRSSVQKGKQAIKDIFTPWSVVGEWRVTHPGWTDVVTLRSDGTLITTRQQTTGRWILTADAGTPLLVIRWDLFATESLAMITSEHFRGQAGNGRFIDMQRGEKRAEKDSLEQAVSPSEPVK